MKTKSPEIEKLKQINNDKLLAELDSLLLTAVGAISQNNHEKVTIILNHFITHDLTLKKVIARILQGFSTETSKPLVSEATKNKVLELQSYYNAMRNNLFVEIINVLFKGYETVMNTIRIDIEYSIKYFDWTKRIQEYYAKSLKFLAQKTDDEHASNMYMECMQNFEEVTRYANKCTREIRTIQFRGLQR